MGYGSCPHLAMLHQEKINLKQIAEFSLLTYMHSNMLSYIQCVYQVVCSYFSQDTLPYQLIRSFIYRSAPC